MTMESSPAKPAVPPQVPLCCTSLQGPLRHSTRHIYNHGSLTGVTTIHVARWIYLDDKRRLVFASSYDGSLESYMDDFIDKVAWGLNAVFSNGVGYPRTRWLVLGGARDDGAFKRILRRRQEPRYSCGIQHTRT